MAQETTGSMWLRLSGLLAHFSRHRAPRPASPGGRTGECYLCGQRREDLDSDELCVPCTMIVW